MELKEVQLPEDFLETLPGTDNRILVCARLGCPGHKVYIHDVPARTNKAISEINYFGAQIDDIFKGI